MEQRAQRKMSRIFQGHILFRCRCSLLRCSNGYFHPTSPSAWLTGLIQTSTDPISGHCFFSHSPVPPLMRVRSAFPLTFIPRFVMPKRYALRSFWQGVVIVLKPLCFDAPAPGRPLLLSWLHPTNKRLLHMTPFRRPRHAQLGRARSANNPAPT